MVSGGASSKLDGADMGVRYFTKDELRALFTLENPFESVTQQQLHEQHASRRHTDAELDQHLEFLASIKNFHGVSDHDLLFDKDSEKQRSSELQEPENRRSSKGKEELGVEDEANRSVVASVMHDISVVLEDDELHNRSVVAASSDDQETNQLGLLMDGMSIRSPSPQLKKKTTPRKPEIHYRGAPVKELQKEKKKKTDSALLSQAERLEKDGLLVDALDKYMDLFDVIGHDHPSRETCAQKIMFLRKTLEQEEIDDGHAAEDCSMDAADVELFDDECEDAAKGMIDSPVAHEDRPLARGMVIDSPIAHRGMVIDSPIAHRGMVIDSPIALQEMDSPVPAPATRKMVIDSPAPAPAPAPDPDCRLCVVCL
jgi:hypothetical protein